MMTLSFSSQKGKCFLSKIDRKVSISGNIAYFFLLKRIAKQKFIGYIFFAFLPPE